MSFKIAIRSAFDEYLSNMQTAVDGLTAE